MKFRQSDKVGSCDIIFEDSELKIIAKHKKLHLDAVSLRHFGNVLVRIVYTFQSNFSDELKNLPTFDDPIKGKKPKE